MPLTFATRGPWFPRHIGRRNRLGLAGFQPAARFDVGDADDEFFVHGDAIEHLLQRSVIQLGRFRS